MQTTSDPGRQPVFSLARLQHHTTSRRNIVILVSAREGMHSQAVGAPVGAHDAAQAAHFRLEAVAVEGPAGRGGPAAHGPAQRPQREPASHRAMSACCFQGLHGVAHIRSASVLMCAHVSLLLLRVA